MENDITKINLAQLDNQNFDNNLDYAVNTYNSVAESFDVNSSFELQTALKNSQEAILKAQQAKVDAEAALAAANAHNASVLVSNPFVDQTIPNFDVQSTAAQAAEIQKIQLELQAAQDAELHQVQQQIGQFSAGAGSVLPDAGSIQAVQLQQMPNFSAGAETVYPTPGAIGSLERVSFPSDSDYAKVCGVIAAEAAAGSVEDARAVADVIINRCRSGAWGGKDPLSVVSAPGQFAVWRSGAYLKKKLTDDQFRAVKEEFIKAASGLPTNYGYQSFRSSGSVNYSNTQVVPNGNRYR